MKKCIVFLLFVCVFSIASPTFAATFRDVKQTTESGQAIQLLADRQIVAGYADHTFRPKATLTRGQAAKMVAKILDVKPTYFIETQFEDVNPKVANYEAIMSVAELGIMSGYSDGTFRPEKRVTRGQAAKIISEAFRLRTTKSKHPYKDVKKEEISFYVANLYNNHVTKSPGTKFAPNAFVTREQFALFLIRGEKAQKAFTMYAVNEQYSAFGYTEFDEDVIDVELDLSRLTIHPIKEGTARLAIYSMDEYEQFERHFYVVHVTKEKGQYTIKLVPESIFDYISYVTSVYHYNEGLYLKFVPTSFELYDEQGKPLSPYDYKININGEEVEVTLFKDGAFQLYFSNDQERPTHAILATIENFILDFSIETISPFIELTKDDLDYTISSASIVDYLNYAEQDSPPFSLTLQDERLLISPNHLGEGVIRIIDSNGTKHYIDVIVHQKAGLLVVDVTWD